MISAPQLSLRQLADADLDFLAEMLGDPDVMRYWPKPMNRAEAERWLRTQQERYKTDGCGYWLIVDRESQQPVGQAGVLMTIVEGERLPCTGYMIHKPYQRQSYGINAAFLCVAYIFQTLKADAAYTLIRPENEPSLNLARKLGFRELRTVEHAGLPHLLMARRRNAEQ